MSNLMRRSTWRRWGPILKTSAVLISVAAVTYLVHQSLRRDSDEEVDRDTVVATNLIVRKPFFIVYATQSGTAEEFATELYDELVTSGVEKYYIISLMDIEDFQLDDLCQADRVVFIASTYGTGDPPMSAEEFWKELKSTRPRLQSLNFWLFGLGDKSYGESYNKFSKDLKKKLESLGAHCVSYGKGDDSADKYEQWDTWKSKIFFRLLSPSLDVAAENLSADLVQDTNAEAVGSMSIIPPGVHPQQPLRNELSQLSGSTAKDIFRHVMTEWEVLSSEVITGPKSDQFGSRSLLLKIRLKDPQSPLSKETWKSFDQAFRLSGERYVFSFLPENSESDVLSLLKLGVLDVSMDDIDEVDLSTLSFSFNGNEAVKWPESTTLMSLLTTYLDVFGDVVGEGNKKIWEQYKGILQVSVAGKLPTDLDMDLIPKAKWNHYQLLAFLSLFDVRVSLISWLKNVHHLKPRLYSVANASETEEIELVVSETSSSPVPEDIRGTLMSFIPSSRLTSEAKRVLEDPIIGSTATRSFFRDPSTLRGRLQAETTNTGGLIGKAEPLLLIGTGSGIAPLRRLYLSLLNRSTELDPKAPRILIYGNRYLNDNLPLLSDEILKLLDHGWEVYLCESRPPPTSSQRSLHIKDDVSLELTQDPFVEHLKYHYRPKTTGVLHMLEGKYVKTAVQDLLESSPELTSAFLSPSSSSGRIEICGKGSMIQGTLSVLDEIIEEERKEKEWRDEWNTDILIKNQRIMFEKFD